MINNWAKVLLEAYFKGGNAQGKNAEEIRAIIKVIKQEVMKED